MQLLIAFLSLLLAQPAWGEHRIDSGQTKRLTIESAKNNCPKPTANDSELESTLKKLYQPYVSATRREVKFYHYGWRTPRYPNGAPPGVYDDSVAVPSTGDANDFDGPIAPNPKANIDGKIVDLAEHYFRVKSAAHFESNSQMPEYGAGLYTAVDPISSQGFLGKKGLLLVVGVPSGMSYLDFREKTGKITASKEQYIQIYCAILEHNPSALPTNFDATFSELKTPARINTIDLLRSPRIRGLLKNVYRDLKVNFIVGLYGSYVFPDTRHNPELGESSEAIFVNPESAKQLNLKLLVASLEKSAPAEKKNLYEGVFNFLEAYRPDNQNDLRVDDKKSFETLYRPWAAALRQYGPGTDWLDFQKKQSDSWFKQPTRLKSLTSSVFGWNKDFPSEYTPPN